LKGSFLINFGIFNSDSVVRLNPKFIERKAVDFTIRLRFGDIIFCGFDFKVIKINMACKRFG